MNLTKEQMLNLKVKSFDFKEELTIRSYFKELMIALWGEKESFSGKRPLGNSGWAEDLYKPLIEAGTVKGSLDEDGCIVEMDTDAGQKVIKELILECLKDKE